MAGALDGLEMSGISIPIEIWHGAADINNPLQSALYLRETIPGSHATILEREGHFHIFKHWGEILDQIPRT
jgi:pimeloyl-ACP methyl ester carboxylesterase